MVSTTRRTNSIPFQPARHWKISRAQRDVQILSQEGTSLHSLQKSSNQTTNTILQRIGIIHQVLALVDAGILIYFVSMLSYAEMSTILVCNRKKTSRVRTQRSKELGHQSVCRMLQKPFCNFYHQPARIILHLRLGPQFRCQARPH